MKQEELADKLKVCVAAISQWERGIKRPRIHHRSKVISFLGFNPWKKDSQTLGERLRQYRNENGLTQVALADLIGTDATNISDWELGYKTPIRKSKKKLRKVISLD
ncbi:MAG TPA: helix-turn-helix transcriptional regulator [Chitinophagales bacterium]|nr:helix-turn-helix transcriptional regulator [Chitinophagales bacterium]